MEYWKNGDPAGFIVSPFEPLLFTLQQLRSVRLIFVRNLGIVQEVSNGGHYYQV